MALPTKSDVTTGSFSADGSPFIVVASKSTVDTNTLEYSKDGSPIWATADTTTTDTFKSIIIMFY